MASREKVGTDDNGRSIYISRQDGDTDGRQKVYHDHPLGMERIEDRVYNERTGKIEKGKK